MSPPRQGPLAGIKLVELAGIGPVPMCAMGVVRNRVTREAGLALSE